MGGRKRFLSITLFILHANPKEAIDIRKKPKFEILRAEFQIWLAEFQILHAEFEKNENLVLFFALFFLKNSQNVHKKSRII